MPLKVVLDTNVYSGDKFRLGQAFKTLGSLCQNGHVEVMLPYIVRREFETQLDTNAAEILAAFEKASTRLAAGPIPGDLRAELDELRRKFKTRKQEVIGSHSADFAVWRQEHAVSEMALSGDHAVAAMENYFAAGAPFKSAKTREDIPDAMLYQAVIDLANAGSVIFVCNDRKLAISVADIGSITHYGDLNEFLASTEVQAIIAQHDTANDVANLLLRLKALTDTLPNLLTEYVSDHGGEQLAGMRFSSPSVPGDDREAYVYQFGNLYDIEFDWDSAAYHGDLVYVVPFAGAGIFNINYFVSKWDAHEIESRGASYRYHNDYVVEADEEAELWVTGMLRIQVSDEYTPEDDLADAIEEMSIDSVDAPRLIEDRD
ncbi:PIN domain-containing protein [Stenotrophomonas cyclobalanopsidis]|uniref:PIN domain-containing protein n=1 Tax=Stenotrophomonas cyclobalanopsidis TaxID=2771362 RepID=UPI00345F98CA